MLKIAKAAQMTAYFLWKHDGKMDIIKMMKLLYLSEKKSILERGILMTGDTAFALPKGPVLTAIYDLAKNRTDSKEWSEWIRSSGRSVGLAKDSRSLSIGQFDCLSPNDIALMDFVDAENGYLTTEEIVSKTHDPSFCPEWTDPKGSSRKIDLEEICTKNGKTDQETKEICDFINEQQSYEQMIAGLA